MKIPNYNNKEIKIMTEYNYIPRPFLSTNTEISPQKSRKNNVLISTCNNRHNDWHDTMNTCNKFKEIPRTS